MAQMVGADFLQSGSDVDSIGARRQLQEALHTQRQGGIHLQALRHVADAQVGTAVDSAAAGHHQPESDLHQCGLAGTVGADERQDLALRQMQVYLLQDVAVTGMEIHRVQVQQGLRNAGGSSGGIGLGRRSWLVQDRVRGLANRWCIIAFNPARLCRYPMIYLVFSLCWPLSTLCRLWQRAVFALIVMLCASVSVAAPVVVVSIKPLQLIAAAVTDGISIPVLAVGAGQDPHHLSLRPSERRALQNAELVLWAGPALEVPLVDVISDIDARVVTAQLLPGIQLGSIEGAIDPHLWLDSHNARHIATALATELQQLDTANADRYVFIVDRSKDMIISGGENIYSVQVEEAISRHEAVLECAVIGIPDEKWGELVMALVVKTPGSALTEDELIAYVKTKLAGYKCPKRIEFRNELARTTTGKLQKFKLRAPYWEGRTKQVN